MDSTKNNNDDHTQDNSIKQPSFDLGFFVTPISPLLDECLAVLQHLDIHHVTMSSMPAWYVPVGSPPEWEDLAAIIEIGDMALRRDIQIVATHTSIALAGLESGVETDMVANRGIIDAAAAWGATSIAWHFHWLRGGDDGRWETLEVMSEIPAETLDTIMSQILPPTCEYGAGKNVQINLEGMPLMNWANDSFHILDYIRRQKLPNLGFALDSGHVNVNGEDLASVIRAAGQLLRDTHFHDNIGLRNFDFSKAVNQDDVDARDLHMIPGLGTTNWIEAIQTLWEIGFSGPIIFETPSIPGYPDESLAHWARCVDLSIRNWRSLEDAARYCLPPT